MKLSIHKLGNLLADNFNCIEFAYLFGSSVDGEIPAGSDIDIAVYIDKEYLLKKLNIGLEIEIFLQQEYSVPVDVTILNKANSILRYQVLKKGSRLFERNAEQRACIENKYFKEYLYVEYYQDKRNNGRSNDKFNEKIKSTTNNLYKYIKELSSALVAMSYQNYLENKIEQRYSLRTLQLAIESLYEISYLIVAQKKLREPNTPDDVFNVLEENKIIDAKYHKDILHIVNTRNILIDNVQEPGKLYSAIQDSIKDLQLFPQIIKYV